MRKCSILVELGDHEGANKYLREMEEVAFQSPNSQAVYKEIQALKKRLAKYSDSEKKFS